MADYNSCPTEIWCPFLPISYNITISLLYPLNSSPFTFSSCVSENHLCLYDKSSYLRAQFDCSLHVHMHYWRTKVQMMSLTLIFFFVFVLSLLHIIKQIDSMLPCICSVINHRRLVVRTLVAHSAYASCAFFFDVICDLLRAGIAGPTAWGKKIFLQVHFRSYFKSLRMQN